MFFHAVAPHLAKATLCCTHLKVPCGPYFLIMMLWLLMFLGSSKLYGQAAIVTAKGDLEVADLSGLLLKGDVVVDEVCSGGKACQQGALPSTPAEGTKKRRLQQQQRTSIVHYRATFDPEAQVRYKVRWRMSAPANCATATRITGWTVYPWYNQYGYYWNATHNLVMWENLMHNVLVNKSCVNRVFTEEFEGRFNDPKMGSFSAYTITRDFMSLLGRRFPFLTLTMDDHVQSWTNLPIDEECFPGSGGAGCTLCPAGTYSPGCGLMDCQRCPMGKTTVGEGAEDVKDCVLADRNTRSGGEHIWRLDLSPLTCTYLMNHPDFWLDLKYFTSANLPEQDFSIVGVACEQGRPIITMSVFIPDGGEDFRHYFSRRLWTPSTVWRTFAFSSSLPPRPPSDHVPAPFPYQGCGYGYGGLISSSEPDSGGSYGDELELAGDCTECPAGTYSSEGAEFCLLCPYGTSTLEAGSGAPTDCVPTAPIIVERERQRRALGVMIIFEGVPCDSTKNVDKAFRALVEGLTAKAVENQIELSIHLTRVFPCNSILPGLVLDTEWIFPSITYDAVSRPYMLLHYYLVDDGRHGRDLLGPGTPPPKVWISWVGLPKAAEPKAGPCPWNAS